MSSGLNRCTFIGNLGADPELKTTTNGTSVTTFSIAVNESWTDKSTGEKQERVEWIRLVAWQRLAEVCAEFLKKGKQVYVEGRMQTREWDDKEGIKRWTTEIVINTMIMLGLKGDSPQRQDPGPSEDDYYGSGSNEKVDTPVDDDDDIPF